MRSPLLIVLAVVCLISDANLNLSSGVHGQGLQGVPCPVRAASGDIRQNSVQVYFHSPVSQRDLELSYDGSNWSTSRANLGKLLPQQGFNSSQPVMVYAHAFMQSSTSAWLEEVRQVYDQQYRGQFNLFLYDWSSYSRQRYDTAASWVPRLGQVLAEFLAQLQAASGLDSNNQLIERTHLVSYSLSTHIAGQAGRYLQKQLGAQLNRITALDPTGVCFHSSAPFANEHALKPTDARLVVARHFDMFTLGSSRPIGGVDIYVNGGKNQPTPTSAPAGGLVGAAIWPLARAAGFRAASHSMAARNEVQVLAEQKQQCRSVAYACSSYAAFLEGECADCGTRNQAKCMDTNSMDATLRGGSNSNSKLKSGTNMYIKTTADSSCIYHYQAVLKLRSRPTRAQRQLLEEALTFVFVTSAQDQRNQKAKVNHELTNLTYTALLTTANGELADSKRILMRLPSVSDDKQDEQMGALSNLVESLELNYMSHEQASVRSKRSAKFCITPKSRSTLRKCK